MRSLKIFWIDCFCKKSQDRTLLNKKSESRYYPDNKPFFSYDNERMSSEDKIVVYTRGSNLRADRKYYFLTKEERLYYLCNYQYYLTSIDALKVLICGGDSNV